MKTIKIFLASSEEMDYDRMVFGNLVRRLDDVYEKRGLRIKLFEWEDYDAAFNDRRKQDEYNDYVKDSDIFLALFHKKAGKFTIEEFDVASEAFKEKASPKVYTCLKDLQPGEEPSPELDEFKKRLFEEMGHYWCRYDNRDSLQLQFVMQLQLVESSLADSVKVEDGEVNIDGMKVASMDKLQFAAANEDYVKMSEELAALPAKIEKARLRLEKFPDDEDLIDELQLKLNKYNKLKEDFAEYQKLLFNTARRVAQLQGERVTERMRRAMDAFNTGKVREANIILDEAEADARRNLEDYKQSKEITELKRRAVISSIEELLLKTSTVMADASIPIDERIEKTDQLVTQIDELVQEVEYDAVKYANCLYRQGITLLKYISERAIYYLELSLQYRMKVLSANHPDIANSYNGLGLAHFYQGEYSKALVYNKRALTIRQIVLGENNPDTATSYFNIGSCHAMLEDYPTALTDHQKAMEIRINCLGIKHSDTARSYHEIGFICDMQKEYNKALEYYQKAVEIQEQIQETLDIYVAFTYSNIGDVYSQMSDYTQAVKYYEKALKADRTDADMQFIAMCHEKIGDVCMKQESYNKALEHYNEALLSKKWFWEDDEEEEIVEMQNKIKEIKRTMSR